MKLTLKDGSVLEVAENTLAIDAVKSLSQGLAKAALAVKLDEQVTDLFTPLTSDCTFTVLTGTDDEGLRTLRHTASHVLAQAVKKLYPEAKLAIGPAIDNGFYYDFDTEETFDAESLRLIEKEMKRIVDQNHKLERFTLPREEAIALMREKGEDYKV
ncbi:MAG: TGS domain-containing protein, partial [Clostridia bacterium]|nr:TGS domain-containing protein [Clostridia bacterium]